MPVPNAFDLAVEAANLRKTNPQGHLQSVLFGEKTEHNILLFKVLLKCLYYDKNDVDLTPAVNEKPETVELIVAAYDVISALYDNAEYYGEPILEREEALKILKDEGMEGLFMVFQDAKVPRDYAPIYDAIVRRSSTD